MGMFDVFGSEYQVKIFTTPFIMGDVVHFSYGSLHYYKEGEEVPYKTWWYNYGKNFLVLNKIMYSESYSIHFIEDGKYIETFDNEIPEISGRNIEKIVDKYGTEIKMEKTTECLREYVANLIAYEKELSAIFERHSQSLSRLHEYCQQSEETIDQGKFAKLVAEVNNDDVSQDEEIAEAKAKYLGKYEYVDNNDAECIGGYLGCLKEGSYSEEVFENLKDLIRSSGLSKNDYYNLMDIDSEDRVIIDNILSQNKIDF